MNTLAPALHIPPLTNDEKQRLNERWQTSAADLLERDGTNMIFKNGGHRIKQDPLLQAAITEIRDGYYELFNESRHLYSTLRPSSSKGSEFDTWNQNIQTQLYLLVMHNAESLERMQQPDYGFSAQEKSLILNDSKAPETLGLSASDAEKIIGSIISRSLRSFRNAFPNENIELSVPPTYDTNQFGYSLRTQRTRLKRFGQCKDDTPDVPLR